MSGAHVEPELAWIDGLIAFLCLVWLVLLIYYVRSQSPSTLSALTSTVQYALQTDMPAPVRVRLLKEVSSCYADRTRHRLSWTCGIVESIAIGVVGVVVGLAVLALFLPLVDLINNLSG